MGCYNLFYALSEHHKLLIVMRNMHPIYVERLSLETIVSLPQLEEKCKQIETPRYRVGRQMIPQIHRKDLLEPAFAYLGSYVPRQRVAEVEIIDEEPEYLNVAHISNPSQGFRLCYNCGAPGHQFNQCVAERRLFCYKCGMPDCVTRNCQRCRNKGNELASSHMEWSSL